mgnify:CR=1 FL=1
MSRRARGNVTVESDNGYVLLSNSIVWDDRYGVISSKDSVVFFSAEGDTMYGVGFESDSDLDNIRDHKRFKQLLRHM